MEEIGGGCVCSPSNVCEGDLVKNVIATEAIGKHVAKKVEGEAIATEESVEDGDITPTKIVYEID